MLRVHRGRMKYNRNDAKAYLNRLAAARDQLKQLCRQYVEVERNRIYIRSIDYSDPRVQHSKSSQTEGLVFRSLEDRERIGVQISEVLDEIDQIMVQIDGLSNEDYKLILTCRYFTDKNLEWIAADMGISPSNAYILYRKALQELADHLSEAV